MADPEGGGVDVGGGGSDLKKALNVLFDTQNVLGLCHKLSSIIKEERKVIGLRLNYLEENRNHRFPKCWNYYIFIGFLER